MLAEHGQYLPFDPPLAAAGATLGGTVAAGLSGPGRYRYGGVRDFVLGVRFVDGMGNLVRGGGKVVKNAAGFDFPKLMVGSLGRLGVLAELSFKVFPQPPAFATLAVSYHGILTMHRRTSSASPASRWTSRPLTWPSPANRVSIRCASTCASAGWLSCCRRGSTACARCCVPTATACALSPAKKRPNSGARRASLPGRRLNCRWSKCPVRLPKWTA